MPNQQQQKSTQSKEKLFAVRVFVKAKQVDNYKRPGKTFKGIAKAKESGNAANLAVDLLVNSAKDWIIPIQKEDIVIKQCQPYDDFAVH